MLGYVFTTPEAAGTPLWRWPMAASFMVDGHAKWHINISGERIATLEENCTSLCASTLPHFVGNIVTLHAASCDSGRIHPQRLKWSCLCSSGSSGELDNKDRGNALLIEWQYVILYSIVKSNTPHVGESCRAQVAWVRYWLQAPQRQRPSTLPIRTIITTLTP